jgi:hypothetical protein
MAAWLPEVRGADVTLPAMPHLLELDAEAWAIRITARWRASVEAIIEVGQLLIDAKGRLPHGAFGKMLENDLPFGASTAQRLMAVAADNRLSNPAHVQHLPASWGTLYELTKLSDGEFEEAIEQKIIRPDMERKEIELIRPAPERAPREVESSDGRRDEAHPVAMLQDGHDALSQADAALGQHPRAGVAPGPSEATPLPNGARAIMGSRAEPDDSLDFFPTPPWATRALIERVFPHLERRGHCKWQSAWEPACGEGHMAEVLREYFNTVYATDIHDYRYGEHVVDFLLCDVQTDADWIVTNPPFGDKTEAFVLKALELAGTGVAMFVRLQWLETIGRYEAIFRDHAPTLIAFFAERVPLCKDRWNPDGDTATAYIWLVWIKGAERCAPFWIPPGCREALSKSDDVTRFTTHPVKRGEEAT